MMNVERSRKLNVEAFHFKYVQQMPSNQCPIPGTAATTINTAVQLGGLVLPVKIIT